MSANYSKFTSFANELADAARDLIRDRAGPAPDPIQKDDGSPVTAVDQAVEDRLRRMIAETYPGHGIVGEERGASGTDKEFIWVIDPIDGTLPFLAGFPVYGTLLALVHAGAPVLGMIEMPITQERWAGCQGFPSTYNGALIKTRPCPDLASALLSTSNPDFYAPDDRPALDRMRATARWTVYGGSCMAYGRIASGRIDVGIDVGFDPTDFLALVPVITGAGGVISDWNGAPLTLQSGGRLVASGDPAVHEQVLSILEHVSAS